ASKDRGQVLVERAPDEPGGVGVLDEAGGGRDDAGNADADRRRAAVAGLQPMDERRNRGKGGVVVPTGRGHALPAQLASAGVERDALNLGPAEVDADSHATG